MNNSTKKEIVIKHGGWGFSLPEGHEATVVAPENELLRLSLPGTRGETCRLLGTTETDEEIVYEVERTGFEHSVGGQPQGYAFPSIQEELERLRQRFLAAGGDEVAFGAWATGEGYDEHLSKLRSEIRRMEREG